MNKITKIGVSALCGSLAAVSAANAGAMSVAGSATATYLSVEGAVTGNPLGMNSGLTFTGTGELESGVGITLNIAHADKNAWSTASIVADVPGLGKFAFDQGSGTGLDRIDDMMPTAWEETDGTGTPVGMKKVEGAGNSMDIEWALSSDILPEGMSAYAAWSPLPDGTSANDKASGGATHNVQGHGWDVVLMYDNPLGMMEGLNIFGGYSWIDQVGDDRESGAIGATYAIGGFTVGYLHTYDSNPAIGATADAYENDAYAVSFNVNDDLSVSYGVHESTKETNNSASDVKIEAKSLQLAYTIGGASVKVAETDVKNKSYGTSDFGGTTIALSLAF